MSIRQQIMRLRQAGMSKMDIAGKLAQQFPERNRTYLVRYVHHVCSPAVANMTLLAPEPATTG